jgi:hypothetical protein
MKKSLADADAKKKYEALKDEVKANMTKDNSWRNGVMSGPVSDKTEDVPMHEIKPLAYQEENASGDKGPIA